MSTPLGVKAVEEFSHSLGLTSSSFSEQHSCAFDFDKKIRVEIEEVPESGILFITAEACPPRRSLAEETEKLVRSNLVIAARKGVFATRDPESGYPLLHTFMPAQDLTAEQIAWGIQRLLDCWEALLAGAPLGEVSRPEREADFSAEAQPLIKG